jgi:hypothetical protein
VFLLLSHARHPLEASGRYEEGRLGVSHAERAEQLQVLGETEAEVPAWDDRVDALDRNQVVGRERRRRVRGERAPEGIEGIGLQFHSRGHPVTSEADQVLGA